MSIVEKSSNVETQHGDFAAAVEALLDSPELEGVYNDTRECASLVLGIGRAFLSPPPPRPRH
ncbi:hypothetical protein SAMN02982929_00458 [Saccharopolyspora kobensis]|uniref:Uncharacterized protein n=1 Tax=Saccharopolyspora kobensis TaxID=146035 RepID=A0A1H5UC11_9PSEU|nr:hypothetical protein [Saccharopolyspora kobensis]SEF71777.1 hypothetical protein SAMN02982929_00458 [Saccharopolyspora kobensis]SFC75714.1 hypothetical protein SAMN05216506_1011612 [Saccharopolyspora kobensis]